MLEEVIKPAGCRYLARTVFYRGWPPPRGGGARRLEYGHPLLCDDLAGFVDDVFMCRLQSKAPAMLAPIDRHWFSDAPPQRHAGRTDQGVC